MTGKRQKAPKVKCKRKEYLTNSKYLWNIVFSRRSIWGFAGAPGQMNSTLQQNRPEDTQNWTNLYLEPHYCWIYYVNINLRHQYGNFCRWVADVPPRDTSPAVKREEKQMFSQATTNMIKKKTPCVQIQTLTSLCKNSTRNKYGIFYRPCFKSCIKRSLFFGQVARFSQTITHVMFCSLFSICPRYYDKNGKIMRRLSSKLNGCFTQIENSKWWCHF